MAQLQDEYDVDFLGERLSELQLSMDDVRTVVGNGLTPNDVARCLTKVSVAVSDLCELLKVVAERVEELVEADSGEVG